MKRNWTIRLFLGTMVIAMGMIIFSYARARASRPDDPTANGEGKCEGSKTQSQFVLWETLTHNLLINRR